MSAFFRDLQVAVRLADVVDVLLLAAVLFVGIGWLRRSRSGSAARRVTALGVVFALVYGLADVFDLYLMERLLGVLLIGVLLAAVVVFQSDLRRLLDRIGAWSLSGRSVSPSPISTSPVDVLTEAAFRLAESRTGALVAVRGREPWEAHVQGGVELDGRVSRPLLYSIFQPDSPGHDGAVLLEGDRVMRFATHLPLSTHLPEASRFGGTRHAAALGLSEECDALLIVVSEERGTISVARDGVLDELESAAELRRRLESFWTEHYSGEKGRGTRGWSRRTAESAAMSLALAACAWLVFSYSGDIVYRSYEVPVEFRNLPAGLSLQRDTALTALVTLAGSDQALRRLDPAQLAVSFDLAEPELGENELLITEEQLRLPSGVRLYDVSPRELEVGIRRQVAVELPVRVRTTGTLADSLVLVSEPERITLLATGDTADLPDHVPTEPVDLGRIPRAGGTTVRLALPPGLRVPGGAEPEVSVRLARRAGGSMP